MPYLPQRRFRPAGTRTGSNFSPSSQDPNSQGSSGFVDYTMPKWLRDALAKAQAGSAPTTTGGGGKVLASPVQQQTQQADNYYGRGRGTNRAPEVEVPPNVVRPGVGGFEGARNVPVGTPYDGPFESPEVEGGAVKNFLHGLFPFVAGQGIGFDDPITGTSSDPKPGLLGNVQQFFEPEPGGQTEPAGGLAGIGQFIENFVLPGTERFVGATEQFNHDRGTGPGTGIFNDLFDQGTGVGALQGLYEGIFGAPAQIGDGRPPNPTDPGGVSYISPEDIAKWKAIGIDLFGTLEEGTTPGGGPAMAFDIGDKLLGDFYLAQSVRPDLGVLPPPPPSFQGAGGGGFGGFNFEPGDPADPRFWLDLVRWLI